jgi:hypothetical protein
MLPTMVNQRLPSEARHRNPPFPYPWQTACTLSHPFRQLSQAEYDRLSLDEKLAYLQMLMGDIREKTDETRRAIEARKKQDPSEGS